MQSPPGTLIKERAHLLVALEGFNEMYLEEQDEYLEELDESDETEYSDPSGLGY